jgi:type VI secretion system protein
MALRLEVIRHRGLPPEQPVSLHLGGGACTLGRNSDNDLVLADPERLVSGRHASIEVRDDGIWLSDRSTNGTFINRSPERLPPNRPVALHDGDTLSIGPYDIAVAIDAEERLPETDPFAQDEAILPGMQSPGPEPDIMDLLGGSGGQPASKDRGPSDDPFADAHPLDAFLAGPAPVDEGPQAAEPRATPVEHVFFRPPESQPIPEGYDLLSDELPTPDAAPARQPAREPAPGEEPQQPPPPEAGSIPGSGLDLSLDLNLKQGFGPLVTPATGLPGVALEPPSVPPAPRGETFQRPGPVPVPPQRIEPRSSAETPSQLGPPPAAGAHLAALLTGLGTGDPGAVKDPGALIHDAGALLRALTTGLTDTMMARSSFKSELRLGVTTIRRAENNPFKFSVSPEEALERLLLRPNPAYLPPLDAAREAFEDIQAHEMAMIAGLRAALRALLARFEPSALEARIEAASGLDRLLPMARKSRYWDQFTQTYGQVAADAAEDFMQLFGEAFTRAYEDQVLRLAQARARRPPG